MQNNVGLFGKMVLNLGTFLILLETLNNVQNNRNADKNFVTRSLIILKTVLRKGKLIKIENVWCRVPVGHLNGHDI